MVTPVTPVTPVREVTLGSGEILLISSFASPASLSLSLGLMFVSVGLKFAVTRSSVVVGV